MEWLWQFFYTLLPSKYPPMALSTLKTFLGGNSSDTLFFILYLEIFGWEQLKKAPCIYMEAEGIYDCCRRLPISHIFISTGKATPASKVRDVFAKQGCRRAAINEAFTLSNTYSETSLPN